MKQKAIREAVKAAIIAQGGKLYGYNATTICKALNCTATDFQNAMNYYRFSPQQANFRNTYNYH